MIDPIMMVTIFAFIFAIWFVIGLLWFLNKLFVTFDSNAIKDVFFVDYFVRGNLFGKVLCILAVTLLLPWIALLFIINGLVAVCPSIVYKIEKLARFVD